jgi:DNA-binding transcriptional MocR family regulator
MINFFGHEINWVPKISDEKKTIYAQIAECIEKDIENGILKIGTKLPPQRVLANYLDINHSTVTRAYKLCEEKGLVKGVIGSGTFVSINAGIPNNVLSEDNRNIIEMGTVLPLYEINEEIEANIKKLSELINYEIAFKYCPPEGHLKHRYIASKWLNNFSVETSPDNILITSGTQNALATILMGQFAKGDRIATDSITYPGIKNIASLLGIILVSIDCDDYGMDPDHLENVCKSNEIKGIYLIPDCHNPTTISMPLTRRKVIANIIKNYNLILIEDGTFSFITEEILMPISSIIPENSFYIKGTSKALNPSFRISYLVAPKIYVKTLAYVLNNLTWMASPFNAEIVSLFITSNLYAEIVKKKRDKLKERNKIYDKVMADHESISSINSMYRFLTLSEKYDDVIIERMCYERGVQVFSAKRFLIGPKNEPNGLRIAVSAPNNIDDLMIGLEIIRSVLHDYEGKYVY